MQAISGRLDLEKEFAPIARTGTLPSSASASASPQAFAKEITETIARERETVGKLGLKG